MALPRREIERQLGPVDNQLAADLAGTDASPADLAKALAWLGADESRMNEGAHLPTGKVAELIGILETQPDDELARPTAAGDEDWQ